MSQVSAKINDPASVDAAIENRFSARAFLPTPVPRQVLESILHVASRAPSGTNAQPWKVYVLQGAKKDELVQKVCAVHDELRQHPELETKFREDYDYYPRHWVEPYLGRRRQNGWSLYGLLGIGKADKDRMHQQQQRNFRFFDAPVGMMFTIDRILGRGSLLDPETGARFWREILAVGGSRPALESFKAFRGREPRPDALLRHSGMVASD